MKNLLLLLSLLFIVNCGSRKKNTQKESEKIEFENTSAGKSETNITRTISNETNLSQFLENKNIKIVSDGTPYSLQYGSLVFSGSANFEMNEKKEETKYLNRYTDYFVYHNFSIYKTYTTYKTHKTFKTINVDRSGLSFGNMIWIVIGSILSGAVIWELLKSFIPILIKKYFYNE